MSVEIVGDCQTLSKRAKVCWGWYESISFKGENLGDISME